MYFFSPEGGFPMYAEASNNVLAASNFFFHLCMSIDNVHAIEITICGRHTYNGNVCETDEVISTSAKMD